ncbi:CPBP family intramembrane glutamic endopeptidase [Ruminococcus albus]|uniref:CAAX prenyl protease 2/Lysostaphin resistance protein A-like domain-containing protein n=1 Tax=Ruminococcus albus TaxID=1264 RepID=A0A1H7KA80_RUMAL|nr:CPBP family intramembrane glutamic endopeptidase [Ruminococcus albus]SEK83773.1 hypothetical protein SAMN05216469_106137 [Ruminococcus albus]
MKENKKMRITALIFYLVLYALWAVFELVIVPKLQAHTLPVSIKVIKEMCCKTVFWTLPAIILILRNSDSMYIKKSEILGDAKKADTYLTLLGFMLLFSVWMFLPTFIQNKTIAINPSFNAEAAIEVIFVGISEELVFRGTLLNTALKDREPWLVFSGNAVMFLMIHFPVWCRQNLFVTYMSSFAFVQLIILSLIFSWSFVKTRSIIVPIILHAYWDLLCSMT